MAHLVRPWIVRYVDAAGKRVTKTTPGAKAVRERSAKWFAQGVPGHPAKRRIPLASDKRVAKRMLAELVERGERGVIGMPARDEASRPIGQLVEEFRQSVARASAKKHARAVVTNVNRVLEACRVATVADLRADNLAERVEAYVWSLTKGDGGVAGATANYTGKHARQFTRWCWLKRKVLHHDPLAGMALPSQEPETPRRAITAEELATLVTFVEKATNTLSGMTGRDRVMIYLTAVATGYRTGELASLSPARLDLDADVPVARLPGKRTKNKKPAEQPIPPAIAERLRVYVAGRPVDQPIWPGNWKKRSAEMLQKDLTAAGIPIVVDDEHAFFHSLRHSYTTLLAQTAPIKVVQELARHSTPVLTIGRYTHAGLKEKAEAVGRLPLPGCGGGDAGPFAALSRPELEALAESLTGWLAALLVAPPVAPNVDSAGDSAGPAGTVDEKPRRQGGARKF